MAVSRSVIMIVVVAVCKYRGTVCGEWLVVLENVLLFFLNDDGYDNGGDRSGCKE